MKTRRGKIGIPLSVAIHLAILAIPLNMIIRVPAQSDEKKVTLLFERARPTPKPHPPPPREKPKARPKPVEQQREQPPPAEPLSPIEAEVVGRGGIDIPSGPAYEEAYLPPPGPACGNGKLEAGEECDDGNAAGGDGCSAACAAEPQVTPPPVDREKLLEEYKQKVYGIIQSNKNYPPAARRRGLQGAAGVAFAIGRDGSVEGVRVIKTSNYALLDDAAAETIRKIGRFPPLPPELEMERLELGVSIVFRLE
ncbi:MAG: TonB family protein [bacterium]